SPSPTTAEVVRLRDRTCVFPHCTRPARACDLDHVIAHAAGGATCECNLAPLCRHHHRLKTHAGWTYRSVGPGVYVWRDPHGQTFLTTRTGTLNDILDTG
ncbi:MAG: putative endonuclease, partial [Nocardioides sp.]|nr:putative endonuclease [Nocardioides sp.]